MRALNLPAALLFLFAFSLQSCEQIIEVEFPPHEAKLTVNSTFSPDSDWFVHLSSSIGVLEEGDPEDVMDGEVVLYANGVVLDTFLHGGDGYYLPSGGGIRPGSGTTYEIFAKAEGYDDVSASASVPEEVPFSNLNHEPVLDASGNPSFETNITFTINDAPGDNYYFVSLVAIDTFGIPPNQGVDIFNVFLETSDPTLGAQALYSDFQFNGLLFTDVGFDGEQREISLTAFESISSGLDYYLVLGNMSEDYYLYGRTYSQTWENDGNPFAEPVMIHGNVQKGYGIFAGFNTYSEPL